MDYPLSHPMPSLSPSKRCGSGAITVKRRSEMSPQSRSGGPGGMQTSGYDGSQSDVAANCWGSKTVVVVVGADVVVVGGIVVVVGGIVVVEVVVVVGAIVVNAVVGGATVGVAVVAGSEAIGSIATAGSVVRTSTMVSPLCRGPAQPAMAEDAAAVHSNRSAQERAA